MNNRRLQISFLVVLLAGTLYLAFLILKPFLAPLALAGMVAVILQPVYKIILKSFGNKKALSAVVTVLLSIICIVVPLTILSSEVFRQAIQLYNSVEQGDGTQNVLKTAVDSLGSKFETYIPGTGQVFADISTNFDFYIKGGLGWVINNAASALSGVSSLILSFLIFLISLYYFLCDGVKLKHAIVRLSPLEDKDDEIIFSRLEGAVNSVVKGSLMVVSIQGIATAIGFAIFGIPNSILWGMITAITALIPGVGTALVIVPGIIYLFAIGSTGPAIGLIIWWLFGVGLIDNMLGPKLVGGNMQLHPLFVLLSILGGVAFFGPIGIFLGPLSISLLFAFITIYSYMANSVSPGNSTS